MEKEVDAKVIIQYSTMLTRERMCNYVEEDNKIIVKVADYTKLENKLYLFKYYSYLSLVTLVSSVKVKNYQLCYKVHSSHKNNT